MVQELGWLVSLCSQEGIRVGWMLWLIRLSLFSHFNSVQIPAHGMVQPALKEGLPFSLHLSRNSLESEVTLLGDCKPSQAGKLAMKMNVTGSQRV